MAHYKSQTACQEAAESYRFGTADTDKIGDGAGQIAEGVTGHVKKRWPFILLLGIYIKVRSDQVARGR